MSDDDAVKIERVQVPEHLRFPEFANAFRVMAEPGGDCIVEFLAYLASSKEAKVVARARVRNEFLVNMRDAINNMLPPQHQQPVVHAGGQLLTPDGQGLTVFHLGNASSDGEKGN